MNFYVKKWGSCESRRTEEQLAIYYLRLPVCNNPLLVFLTILLSDQDSNSSAITLSICISPVAKQLSECSCNYLHGSEMTPTLTQSFIFSFLFCFQHKKKSYPFSLSDSESDRLSHPCRL